MTIAKEKAGDFMETCVVVAVVGLIVAVVSGTLVFLGSDRPLPWGAVEVEHAESYATYTRIIREEDGSLTTEVIQQQYRLVGWQGGRQVRVKVTEAEYQEYLEKTEKKP